MEKSADFGELREKIESIITKTEVMMKKKSLHESSKCLEEALALLSRLRDTAENDVQERAVKRLTEELEFVAQKIDEILSKREAGKEGDGNIAFKCNWNDKHFKAPCSKEIYELNLRQGRAWCSLPSCECRTYDDNVSIADSPCYESIALKEMYFAAGWDHTEERQRPRRIYSARQGRAAILTTRPPGAEENDRIIIGCILIDTIKDDPGSETKIYGDKDKSLEIDYDTIKIKFWDYYKNADDETLVLWASGLFRYISDETILNMLKGIGEQYKNARKDTNKIKNLIAYYEDIVAVKHKRL